MRAAILSTILVAAIASLLTWIVLRVRRSNSEGVLPAEASPKNSSKRSNVAFAICLLLWGILAFSSGKTGSKFAYAEGPHVKFAGVLLSVAGAWGLIQTLRTEKEPNRVAGSN